MKILHVIDYIQPALGYQEYFLAREHSRQGHDVQVAASDRYFPFPDYSNTVEPLLGPRIIGKGISECDGFKIKRHAIRFEFGTKTWMLGLETTVRGFSPDLVICHGVPTFNAVRLARLKQTLGFKLVIDDHTHLSEVRRGLVGYLGFKVFPFRFVQKHADRIIAIADECIKVMVQFYKIPRERIEMISLGADVDRLRHSDEKRKQFREAHGLSPEHIVVVYTGKLTSKKGPHQICEAVANLNPECFSKLALLFVGNTEKQYEATLGACVDRLDPSVRVIQTGAVPNTELVSIYSASDIAVWPRQASMSMLEAMSCGLPIICCDYLKERCKNDNGILIEEDNIAQLTEALSRLVFAPEVRSRMGERGRKFVTSELSWSEIAKRFTT
ncbi:MAG: glycosyltransferase family 4 protein [Kiritimatiellae bacterium]|nr:glycosyltransferase family 4 protein [Kiritimatiellia bacterium]